MRLKEFVSKSKTLFVSRPLLNVDDLQEWAKEQGFTSTLAAGDMHVTIAFSKEKFDWSDLTPKTNDLTIEGGERKIEQLGDGGAITLCFQSNRLKDRWAEIVDAGASWDFPSYLSHVTISYNGDGLDLDDVVPYEGELKFGPEKFKEITEDWSDDIEEDAL